MMVDLSALAAKVKAAQAQATSVAQQATQVANAHNDVLTEIEAAMAAKPTLADIKALVDQAV